jgi:hypothetical protein
VLDDDILQAVLFLGGGDSLCLSVNGLCNGHCGGLSACDAHDDLADAGFRDIGNGCCAVRDDSSTQKVGGWLAQILNEFPVDCFVLGAAFDLVNEALAELVATDPLDLGVIASGEDVLVSLKRCGIQAHAYSANAVYIASCNFAAKWRRCFR